MGDRLNILKNLGIKKPCPIFVLEIIQTTSRDQHQLLLPSPNLDVIPIAMLELVTALCAQTQTKKDFKSVAKQRF
jgi:hypothetical protein